MANGDRQLPLPLAEQPQTLLLNARSIAARWKLRLDSGQPLPSEDVLRGEMQIVVKGLGL